MLILTLKRIEILLRSDLRIAFILIIAAFCVHIVHYPNRKKIQIPDGDAELYARRSRNKGWSSVGQLREVFRLHIRLDIQPHSSIIFGSTW